MEHKNEVAHEVPVQEQLLRERFSCKTIFQMKNEIGIILHKYNLSVLEAKALLLLGLDTIDKVSNDAHLWS